VSADFEFNMPVRMLKHVCRSSGEDDMDVMKYVRRTCESGRHDNAGALEADGGGNGTTLGGDRVAVFEAVKDI